MSVEAIRLRNFRGFADSKIELKPLTVLLGPNSAGKSSFGHALAAMAYAHWKYGGGNKATLSPTDPIAAKDWPVDLGDYEDLRTSGTHDRVYIDLRSQQHWVSLGFGLVEGEKGLLISYIHDEGGEFGSQTVPPSTTEVSPVGQSSAVLVPEKTPTLLNASGGLELRRDESILWRDRSGNPMIVSLDGLILSTVRHQSGTDITVWPHVRNDIKDTLENITYLRATRERPSRSYERGRKEVQKIGYAGEFAPIVLLDGGGLEVVTAIPPSLPRTPEEAQTLLDKPWERQTVKLSDGVSTWLNHLGLARTAKAVESGSDKRICMQFILQHSSEARDITEVGFGLSQILPILVAGLLQPERGLLIVDLPEAHLHPMPQAYLADFFCSLAMSGRSSLVETHSQTLFLRLQLLAEMNKELSDKIAVYFIDPPSEDGHCSCPEQVGLSIDQEPTWPRGFLQESWEIDTQTNAVRQARRKNGS